MTVQPGERRLRQDESFGLRVTARFADGSTRDVTHLAAFGRANRLWSRLMRTARSKLGGSRATPRSRHATRGCSRTATSPSLWLTSCRSVCTTRFPDPTLSMIRSGPSSRSSASRLRAAAGDATFLRRAHLDVIGRLPTSDEARAFLADSSRVKRARLIDRLLDRPEYADHWANKWMDLLRPNPYRVGIKAVFNLDAWIRSAFRRNLPYDQFVREIVTARGSTFEEGPSTIFRDRREPIEIAPVISQLFLGIRLECAKCHHHPFESWGQEQFYEFAAYFARVGRKGVGLSPPISGGEEIVFTAKSGSVKHPLTGKVLGPKPLFGSAPVDDDSGVDPRRALARWMSASNNPYFAKVMATAFGPT